MAGLPASPNYRDAVCCRTCKHVGESILNGAFVCSRHRCPIMGYGICDDYRADE